MEEEESATEHTEDMEVKEKFKRKSFLKEYKSNTS